ncbi:hypothetical protein QWM81_16565 [Streptomyces ficellus]|uniref:Uncharacterized protein n=1 Tax=Streptomyces ficellus TaxID=1977088 RepID=A0ABT7Z810_9ACTN|nr:hypothetical protein [Streptomyces ficellus]MDN3295635.1 hypothetical protein [Streptomyces ficellus]
MVTKRRNSGVPGPATACAGCRRLVRAAAWCGLPPTTHGGHEAAGGRPLVSARGARGAGA